MRYSLAILTTLIIATLLVVLTGIYLFRAAERLEKDTLLVAEGQKTLLLLEQVLSSVKDAETGQRGFILTGDESYLEPYNVGLVRLDSVMALLYSRLPSQKQEYTSLQRLIQSRAYIFSKVINTRRKRGFDDALLELTGMKGKIVMDSIRIVCVRIQKIEEGRTAAMIAQNEEYFRNSSIVIVGGSSTILVLFVGSAAVVLIFLQFRAKSDATIRKEQQFTQSVLNTVPNLVYVFDFERNRLEYTNNALHQFIGYTKEELEDANVIWSLVHTDDVEMLYASVAEIRSDTTNSTYEREYRMHHKDGSWHWFVDRATVFRRDESGAPQQILAFVLDITERIDAEQERQRSEKLLKSVIDTSMYGIAAVEAIRNDKQEIIDFRYVLLNEFARQRFQRSFEEVQETTMIGLFPFVVGTEQFIRYCDVVNSGNNAIFDVQYFTNESNNWFTNACSKFNDGLVIIYYDISDRKAAEAKVLELNAALEGKNADLERLVEVRTLELKRANEDLRITNEQLVESNKELEAFSYSVSHDLRAPLRSVNGFAEILRERYEPVFDDEAKRLLGKIMHGAQKMGVLIDELLSLSRLGRKMLQVSHIDMTELVHSVVIELNAHYELSAYTIEIAPLPQAIADAALLRHVWINLLSNAIKYSRNSANKTISVSSFTLNESLVYAIRDYGVGFDMQYASKLFNVFQRLHKERDFEGTGIGLAIVKRVISKHGGQVWSEAEVNKGATFFFSLPMS